MEAVPLTLAPTPPLPPTITPAVKVKVVTQGKTSSRTIQSVVVSDADIIPAQLIRVRKRSPSLQLPAAPTPKLPSKPPVPKRDLVRLASGQKQSKLIRKQSKTKPLLQKVLASEFHKATKATKTDVSQIPKAPASKKLKIASSISSCAPKNILARPTTTPSVLSTGFSEKNEFYPECQGKVPAPKLKVAEHEKLEYGTNSTLDSQKVLTPSSTSFVEELAG